MFLTVAQWVVYEMENIHENSMSESANQNLFANDPIYTPKCGVHLSYCFLDGWFIKWKQDENPISENNESQS